MKTLEILNCYFERIGFPLPVPQDRIDQMVSCFSFVISHKIYRLALSIV
jgi:hypothetical protein